MFKIILGCIFVTIVIGSPVPDDVRKTANIQKSSEYYLTDESKPKPGSGLTRPSPINPEVLSEPKPADSLTIIPISSTDDITISKTKTSETPVVSVLKTDDLEKNELSKPTAKLISKTKRESVNPSPSAVSLNSKSTKTGAPLPKSNDDFVNHERDEKPPTFVRPVPVEQILKGSHYVDHPAQERKESSLNSLSTTETTLSSTSTSLDNSSVKPSDNKNNN